MDPRLFLLGLLLAIAIALALALGIVRLFRLPLKWTSYVAFALLVVGVHIYFLIEARANPWSLWRRSWMQDSGDPEQRRLARYTTEAECLTAQWKKLEEELQLQKRADQMMKSMTLPGSPTIHLREGRTIFEFRPSLWSSPKLSQRLLSHLGESKDLTPYQKEQMASEMRLPEIIATVSVYCAPSLRYSFWPYYTPTYYAAGADLRRLGERTLAVKAKQMLGE